MNVVDLHGRPVTGLTKSDFRLFEDGVEQKITNFYVVENSAPRPLAQATATTSTAAAPVAPDPQFRRKVVLLVDNNFINNIELNAALRTLDQQIETKYSGDYEWSVSAIGHALEIVQPFTSDKRLIHAAIKKVEHMPTFQAHQAMDRAILSDRTRKNLDFATESYDYGATVRFSSREQTLRSIFSLQNTARAVADLAEAHSVIEGKKLMILLTGGMETNTSFTAYDKATDIEARELRLSRSKLIDAIVREANGGNFAVYVVNARARGMQAPQHDVENRESGINTPNLYQNGGGGDPIDTADTDSIPLQIALGTGGAYLPSNDIQHSFETIEAPTTNFYSLGYSPSHSGDRRYHRITVHVNQPHVSITNRVGYYDLSQEDRLRNTLRFRGTSDQPLGSAPVNIDIGSAKMVDNNILVPIVAAMPMRELTLLRRDNDYVDRVHVYVSIFDATGRNVGFHHPMREVTVTEAEHQDLSESLFRYITNVRLQKGEFTIAVTLRDDLSNEIGSAVGNVRL